MKPWRVFILILASSVPQLAAACGFYPYGEAVRFCFFKPQNFDFPGYSPFTYSANGFEDHYPQGCYKKDEIAPNEKLWFDYCKGNVPVAAIEELVYEISSSAMRPNASNAMLRYLFKQNDRAAIDYLKFAKSCEGFNTKFDDPWERSAFLDSPKRRNLIQQAIRFSEQAPHPQLKMRYTFLAIRMAFYNQDKETIRKLYDSVFKTQSNKDILNYWSLYFRTFAETDKPLANFFAAQVFANAPDKRFRVHWEFDTDVPLESVLKYAKTNEEIAHVYLLSGIRKPDKALICLQKIQQYRPNFEGLDFLLLREVNKIEDWVFTPYYTLFNPSIPSAWHHSDDKISVNGIMRRVESDRAYARQVLRFIQSVDIEKTHNPLLWKMAKAHLLFVTRQYDSSLSEIGKIESKATQNDSIQDQLDRMKALNLTANQPKGKAVILEQVKPVILKFASNKKFLFAIGRELEYNGNTTDAALLYSRLDDANDGYGSDVTWKTKRHKKGSYRDYYYDYFGYADAYYSIAEVEHLIGNIKHSTQSDLFSSWKYAVVRQQISRLYDMLGTKYIRRDNLKKALENFEKVDAGYWNQHYSLWDRERNDGNYFDANPFFTLKSTIDFIPDKDNFITNKTTVAQRLIGYLNKANNPREKDRDYYYMLVGNCYYNMTMKGNCWMMRRFGFSAYDVEPFPEDEAEFRNGFLAKKYYRLAYANAKTDRFKALCLRLSTDYKTLKKKFPDDYERLTGSCDAFDEYFKDRRKPK